MPAVVGRRAPKETEARPREPKIATVERREASVPRYGTQGASQAPGVSRHDTPHGCRCTRTSLGAPPTPRFGLAKLKLQTPGADMRRGNEEVCVLEIVRPGMEDSESAEKQENTGIGPAVRAARPHPEEHACRRR